MNKKKKNTKKTKHSVFPLSAQTAIVVIVVCLIMFQITLRKINERVNDELYHQIVLRGETLVQQMADASTIPLASGQLLIIEELVREIGSAESVSEAYIISNIELITTTTQRRRGITDVGTYAAHSNPALNGEPYRYPEGLSQAQVSKPLVELLSADGERRLRFRREMNYNYHGTERLVGTAELIMNLDEIQTTISRITRELTEYSTYAALVIIILTTIFLHFIFRPLRKLTDAMVKLSEGDFTYQVISNDPSEIGTLSQTFNDMSAELSALQKRVITQELIKRELEIAETIQQNLLPDETPRIKNTDIAAHYASAESVGGDYYDIIHVRDDIWALIIADVSGKGIPGSMVMSMTRSILRSLIQDGLPPSVVLSRCNQVLFNDMPPGMFVTVGLAYYDASNGRLVFASAGHNPPLLRHTGEIYTVDRPGIPLGADDSDLFEKVMKEGEFILNPGNYLIFYTDGVTEAMNRDMELFGLGRLKTILKNYPDDQPIGNLVALLNRKLDEFRDGAPPNDDVTYIVMRRGH